MNDKSNKESKMMMVMMKNLLGDNGTRVAKRAR